MANGNIGGFGLGVTLVASVTFPAGLSLSAFADDADPFDIPDLQIADVAMGLNGDMLSWAKAAPTIITVSLIPESDDDENMSVLYNANRAAYGKILANDIIQLVGKYASGKTVMASNGRITNGSPTNSIASSARLKSKTYRLAFGDLLVTKPTS